MSVTLHQAEKVVGMRPSGDPVKMKETADTLKQVADGFRMQRDAMATTALKGEGGLIKRVNARVESRRTKLLNRALELEDVVVTLTLRASDLANDLDRWERDARNKVPGWK